MACTPSPQVITSSESADFISSSCAFSRNLARAEEFANKFSIERAYGNYQGLLDDPDIQAVIVCSPTNTHAQMIEEAAAAGKHTA